MSTNEYCDKSYQGTYGKNEQLELLYWSQPNLENTDTLSDDEKISLSSLSSLASQYQATDRVLTYNGRYDVFADEFIYHADIVSGPYTTPTFNSGDYIVNTTLSTMGTVTISTTEFNNNPESESLISVTKDWGKKSEQAESQPIKDEDEDILVPYLSEVAAMLKIRPVKDSCVGLSALGNDGHRYDIMEVIHAHTKLMLTMMEKTTKKW